MRISIENCNDITLLKQELYRKERVITSLIESTLNLPKLSRVTRLEVIDGAGRQYTQWDILDMELEFQDFGETLKIFVQHDGG